MARAAAARCAGERDAALGAVMTILAAQRMRVQVSERDVIMRR
jgi:hypothetical protein